MTAKEYLGQIRLAEMKIKHLEDRLASMNSLGGAIQYDKTIVQSTPENITENQLIDLIDMERDIIAEKISLERLKNKVTLEIHELRNPQYVQILYYRYVLGKRPEEIAVLMCYEYESVRKTVLRARRAFGEHFGLDPEQVDPEQDPETVPACPDEM